VINWNLSRHNIRINSIFDSVCPVDFVTDSEDMKGVSNETGHGLFALKIKSLWKSVGEPFFQFILETLKVVVVLNGFIIMVIGIDETFGVSGENLVEGLFPTQLRMLGRNSMVDFCSVLEIGVRGIFRVVEERIEVFSKTIMSVAETLCENPIFVQEMRCCEFFHHDMIESVDVEKNTEGMRFLIAFLRPLLGVKVVVKCHGEEIHVGMDAIAMLANDDVEHG